MRDMGTVVQGSSPAVATPLSPIDENNSTLCKNRGQTLKTFASEEVDSQYDNLLNASLRASTIGNTRNAHVEKVTQSQSPVKVVNNSGSIESGLGSLHSI